MSQWTHIAGIIRLDGAGSIIGMDKQKEEQLVSGILSHSPLPYGSEGPIQYSFHHHGDDSVHGAAIASASAYRGTIVIWGDLRDYGDIHEINKIHDWFLWLKSAFSGTHEIPFWFREGVLVIDIEGEKNKIVLVDDGKKGLVKVKAGRAR